MNIRLILILMAIVSVGASNAYIARSQYISAALLSGAFVLISPVKQSVSSYYLNNGALPQSNRDAGIGVPESISFGRSAIIAAVVQHNVRLVDLLLQFGADPYMGDMDSISALVLARNSDQRAIQTLIKSPAKSI